MAHDPAELNGGPAKQQVTVCAAKNRQRACIFIVTTDWRQAWTIDSKYRDVRL
ncbi:hypothetical protein HNR39_000119 [Glaciimonas immobilis]|uniref:Uncharacterized protein n=1 Tax=Glaciimonas immobilis TaxID=728004 RepID=A0A840RP64_9BURK|nr:hypothetical protein [Glaciimonas immobilis]